MKILKVLALLVALSPLAANARSLAPVKPIYTTYSASAWGSVMTAHILNDGHIQVTRSEDGKVVFNEYIARLDAANLEIVQKNLASVTPSMKIRGLTREEQRMNEGCASDSGYSAQVVDARFPGGAKTVSHNVNCMDVGLSDKRAARRVKAVQDMLSKTINDNSDRIFRGQE